MHRCPSSRAAARPVSKPHALPAVFLLCVMLAGCALPVSVRRVNPRVVHQMLTGNVLSSGRLSMQSQNTLRRWGLFDRAESAPEAVMDELHRLVTTDGGDADEIFALAELAFLHAERTGKRPYYLAAAVYAYAYLFPEGAEVKPPSALDPRLRVACDLYNRALTSGFATADGEEVELRGGVYPLPFGQLHVEFNPASLHWIDRDLRHFVPVAELEVRGLTNRYRRPGIGAPLAASTVAPPHSSGANGFVSPDLRVAATALLRLADPRRQLAQSTLRATLELHTDADEVTIDGRRVPLESEPTAAYASMLVGSKFWEREIRGLLNGDLLGKEVTRLTMLHPYQPGRIPVVLVHGTASSPGRWGDLVNELENDPRLRDKIQIWLFVYDTGNPIAYSANLLREALTKAVAQLEKDGPDPALHQMVLAGHSQGGLLIKMNAIESGDRLWQAFSGKPLDAVTLSPQTKELLRRSYFIHPLPFVRRLVFIATPQHGSFVATKRLGNLLARFAKLPNDILQVSGELLKGKVFDLAFSATHRLPTSVDDMTPGQPFNKALSAIPVAAGVKTHSIIAVKGDGPVEKGDDGVVKYSSAHIDGVTSERVVHSGHSCQSCPEVIDEVRRILLQELAGK